MTTPSSTTDLAQLTGYLARPVPTSDRPGPWPGVVLVHDVVHGTGHSGTLQLIEALRGP